MNAPKVFVAAAVVAASLLTGLAACSQGEAKPTAAAPPPPPEPTLSIELDGKIGEMRELPTMTVARAHWGGNSASQDEFVYEPPPGWIIYSFQTRERSKYGDSWYTPQLISKDAKYATSTSFETALSDLEKFAGEYNNYKAKSDLQEVRKNSGSWSSTFQSANNGLHIKWGGRSEKIYAGPIPVVIDTKTASLNLDVDITIARSVSTAELEQLVAVLKQRIKRGERVAGYFATSPVVPASAPAAAPVAPSKT